MKKHGVSSEEVARLAKVSRTTVSFVLNNTPGKFISEETRTRVLEAASSLNYVPDADARRVAKTTRRTVGLLISHTGSIYSDAYILRLLEGIGPVLNKRRYRLILVPVKRDSCDLLKIVRECELDGVILTNMRQEDMDLSPLVSEGIPLVLVGAVQDACVAQIDIDNRRAAAEATRHLVSLGHRDIAMIVHSNLSYIAATDRLSGYRDALSEADIAFDESRVRIADFNEESGYAAMRALLSCSPRPSAIFAGNDAVAYGAIQAIAEAGLHIPRDISIVGFDDDYPSRFMNPPLTSMTLPAMSLGERAARMVSDIIEGKDFAAGLILLPTFLTVRESTAARRP